MCYTKKTVLIPLFLIFFLLVLSDVLHAQIQKSEAISLYEHSLLIRKNGMIVLGSWAGANILTGGIGYYQNTGQRSYFYQMNAAWNVVNLGIAAFGYRSAVQATGQIAVSEMLSDMSNLDRILLINAGLDLLYMGGGALMWRRGAITNSDRFRGYGKSLILQGGFLLVFDAILYLIHSPQTREMGRIADNITLSARGITVSF